jgi:hypothetical protein
MRPLPRHAAHVSPEFGALMDRSCLVAQRLETLSQRIRPIAAVLTGDIRQYR